MAQRTSNQLCIHNILTTSHLENLEGTSMTSELETVQGFAYFRRTLVCWYRDHAKHVSSLERKAKWFRRGMLPKEPVPGRVEPEARKCCPAWVVIILIFYISLENHMSSFFWGETLNILLNRFWKHEHVATWQQATKSGYWALRSAGVVVSR